MTHWQSLDLTGPPGYVLLCLRTTAELAFEACFFFKFRRWREPQKVDCASESHFFLTLNPRWYLHLGVVEGLVSSSNPES